MKITETPSDGEDEPVACSVLMPVLNEERHIEASVEAMCRQRFPGRLEFLLVDGGSTDRTLEILDRLAHSDGRIRVLTNPRRVASSGLNVALAHARGRWVARMDAHTEYPEEYLSLGVQRLQQGGTRWVSGLAIARGRGPVGRAIGLALKSPLGRGGSRKWVAEAGADHEHELDSGVFAGVWERQTLLDVGGWDERWVRNQDSEMAGRFMALGERLILIPGMAAEYAPRETLTSLAEQYWGYGVYRVWTAGRHPQTMRRSHLLSPAVVVATAAAVIGPRSVRRLARAGMGAYGLSLVLAAMQALREAERPTDAAFVAPVMAAMHFGYGLGALVESVRHRPPVAAIAGILGLDGLARALWPASEEVFAPSLVQLSMVDASSRTNGET